MIRTFTFRAVSILVLACMVAGSGTVVAGVAKRTESLMTLEVPAEHSKLGRVYHIKYPGESAQVTFTSNALLERIVGTSNAVVGYVVAETRGDRPTGRILAGAFRLPVRSFDSGIPMRNGHMAGRFFFNAKEFPEITVAITGSRDVKLVTENDESATYDVTLTGDLTIRDVTRTGPVVSRVTFLEGSEKTAETVGEGDILSLRCSYSVKRSDYNVAPKFMPLDLANEMEINQFMILTTVSANQAVVEKASNPKAAAKVQKFGVLFRDFGDKDGAYGLAETFVRDYSGDAMSLNAFARQVGETDGVNDHALDLAMQAAMRAVDLTRSKNADILETVASLHFGRKAYKEALEWQRKAVANKESSTNPEGLEWMVKQYEAAVAKSK